MMDYFYKLVLKTLLLIGGIERNPGPEQGPPPLVAQYEGYGKNYIWRKIVELLERSLDPSCVVYQQLEDIKNCRYPLLSVGSIALGGHVPAVRLLLQRGANVNKTDSWGDTPLYSSSSNGYLTVCQLLA
uniref:Uncharacterized protein n=1 Tax=Timema poppense TaxID=170557 RepID=A0A7R9DKL1_TIMPO|nr:unnamed protein product [Timema poppensis]